MIVRRACARACVYGRESVCWCMCVFIFQPPNGVGATWREREQSGGRDSGREARLSTAAACSDASRSCGGCFSACRYALDVKKDEMQRLELAARAEERTLEDAEQYAADSPDAVITCSLNAAITGSLDAAITGSLDVAITGSLDAAITGTLDAVIVSASATESRLPHAPPPPLPPLLLLLPSSLPEPVARGTASHRTLR